MTSRWTTRTREGYHRLAGPGEPTSSFTPGTSSASGRSSSARSTTRTRSTREACGSPKGSPTTTTTWLLTAPGCRRATSYLATSRPPIGLLQTTPGRLVQPAGAGVVRRLDQALPARRELAERRRSATTPRARSSRFLLDAKLRRAHERRAQPRRRDAGRLSPLQRRAGLHRRRISARWRTRSAVRTSTTSSIALWRRPRSSTMRRCSTGTVCGSVPPRRTLVRKPGSGPHAGGRRPPAGLQPAPGHPRLWLGAHLRR